MGLKVKGGEGGAVGCYGHPVFLFVVAIYVVVVLTVP